MNFRLRKATEKDFERINALFCEMIRAIYGKDDVSGYGEGDLDYYFADGEDFICVAEIDGAIEGFLSIEVHREKKCFLYLDDFCVSENHRGKGIGTALISQAEEYGKNIGFVSIVLHVEESNIAAKKLYEKRGFLPLRKDGTRLCMVKHLDSFEILNK